MPTEQALKRLHRSRRGIINLAEERKLIGVKIANEFRAYDPESVEDFVHKEETKKAEKKGAR
jgi:hypothetical protein